MYDEAVSLVGMTNLVVQVVICFLHSCVLTMMDKEQKYTTKKINTVLEITFSHQTITG